MANIKSAKKRALTNEKSRIENKMVKTNLKTTEKKLLQACETGDNDAIQTAMKEASKKFDMAASKGVIHKNAANRKKRQFALKVNSLSK